MRGMKIGRIRCNEEHLTAIICTIVVFLAQISEKNHSTIIMMIAYSIALIWAFISAPPMLMAMNLFFLSDNSILNVGGISIQLLIMCIYIARFSLLRKGAVYGMTFLAGLAIAGYSIIYIDLGIGYVLQGMKLAVMIVFMTEYLSEKHAMTKKNYERQISFAIIGVFLSVVAAICVKPTMLLSSRIALSEESNWNLLGILSALLFAHSFMMCFVEKKSGMKYILYSFLMAACALLSTSRTALLVITVSVVWTLLFVNENGTMARKGLIFITIIVFLALLVTGTIQISYVDKLVDRIINPRRGDISNGRFTLWIGYIDYLKEHSRTLLFGYGRTMIEGITTKTNAKSIMAHNIFIEQITMYGFFGTGIVVVLYLSSIKRILHSAKKRIIVFKKSYIIGVLLVFVAGMFSHVLTSVLVTTELYLGLMQHIALNIKEGEKNEQAFDCDASY